MEGHEGLVGSCIYQRLYFGRRLWNVWCIIFVRSLFTWQATVYVHVWGVPYALEGFKGVITLRMKE